MHNILNIILAFFEGLVLIVSPCILPVLPIILSGSLVGSKKRPLGIIFGFVVTFALFTFFSRQLVHVTGIDLTLVRHISYAMLAFLGVIMLSSYLTEKLTYSLQWLANIGSGPHWIVANDPQGGWKSGLLFGCLVGIIWTPCAGPILAAVIVQTVIQETTFASFCIVLSFGTGAAIPMLLIALLGRKMMNKIGFLRAYPVLLRKILGAIIIAVVMYMVYGEENIALAHIASPVQQKNALINSISQPYPAPKITGITNWINSMPLQLDQLRGKVVLIDFWTYSCINCMRTLPYLNDWYAKYHKAGFEIIGVHTPEFEFEKNLVNVKNAVLKDHIYYPVALDNQFITWRNFNNSYWPAHYLLDKNGNVVYQHFGEGEYDVTENNIRYLLGMNRFARADKKIGKNNITQTPETYLGYARADRFKSPEAVIDNHSVEYSFPSDLVEDQWALQGDWTITRDNVMTTKANASIKIHFNAKKVYAVMGSAYGQPIKVKLLLNNKKISQITGTVSHLNQIEVNRHGLYQILEFKHPESGILQLTPSSPGLEIYTFTFGN